MKNLRFILSITLLFVGVSIFAQTKADPEGSLRSTGATAGQILKASTSESVEWESIGNLLSNGAGISITAAGLITNTAPDVPVALTGGGGISITGTYPNFTITAPTATPFQTIAGAGTGFTLSNGGGSFNIIGTGAATVSRSGTNVTVNVPASAAPLYTNRKDFLTTNAIAANGTFTTTGVSLPSSVKSFIVIVDGFFMNAKDSGSDTNWDYDRTGTNQLTFNRALKTGTTIVVLY